MLMKPKFSVITPTYNIGKYLGETLESVSNQKYRNFEHIFIDAYSIDNTKKLIEKYRKRNPDIFTRFIQSEPKGISNAFNIGIKYAQGEFLIFLNGDDYFYNEFSLDCVNRYLEFNSEIKWLQGETLLKIKDKHLRLRNNRLFKIVYPGILSFWCPVNHQNTVMHMDVFKKYGFFKEDMETNQDTDQFQRLIDKIPIYMIKEPISVFRMRKDSISSINTVKTFKYYYLNYKNNKTIPFISGIKWMIKYHDNVKLIS